MKFLKRMKGMLFLVIITALVACSGNNESTESKSTANFDLAPKEEAAEMDQGYGGSAADERSSEKNQSTARMVIYNANLSLEVKEYHKVEASIQEKVASLGGYVVESSIYNNGGDRINGNLVVKVPQNSFHSFINEVESKSVKVIDRHVSGNDVTEEYIDLESRLRSKRVVEERLLSFMEKAEKTEDLLKISSDLGKVQEEIEKLLGRMKYLKTNVDFSTVTIHLSEKLVAVQPIQNKESLNTWIKAKSLFVESTNGIISFFSSIFILTIGLSPILLPVGLIGFILLFYLKKKRNNKHFEG